MFQLIQIKDWYLNNKQYQIIKNFTLLQILIN